MTRRARRWARAAIGAGAVGAWMGGCAGPTVLEEDVEAVITFETVAGARLCAGTERWADEEQLRVQELTGLVPAFDLTVTVGASAVAERCTDPDDPEAVLGCTVGDGAAVEVVTTARALSHELVHALRRHYGLRTQAMFEEGYAELVNGSDPYPRYDELDPSTLALGWGPQTQVHLSPAQFRDDQSYRIAVHFMEYVGAEHGLARVGEFMRGGIDDSSERAVERFNAHFESTLAEHDDAWREAGLQPAARGQRCAEGSELVSEAGSVLSIEVDCDDAQTYGLRGAGEVPWREHCVDLREQGRTMRLGAGAGRVRGDAVPGTCAEGSSALSTSPFELEVGDEVSVAACVWALRLSPSEGESRQAFELAIDPV